MSSIRDVARRAAVSVSTVSHVLNGTRRVEPETVARVRAAIAELGYRPNSIARSLRRGKTHTIGLLVPDNSNPFFAEVARVVEDEGFKAGYSVILCNSDGAEAKEQAYIEVLLSKQVDGLIFIASSNSLEGLHHVMEKEVPVVAVDREIPDPSVPQILVDNWKGGYLAGEHLTRLGHRQIAYITGPRETTPSADRFQGFRQALLDAGLLADEDYIARYVAAGDFRFRGGQEAMSELLGRNISFSAVFAANDLMAMGVLSTLHAAGVQVPGDVSVMGFDDIPYSVAMQPPLTTIAQPVEEIGRASVEMLLERIRPTSPHHAPQRVILAPRLVIRESCAPFRPKSA